MDKELQILIVGDSEADAQMIVKELQKGGLAHTSKWVRSREELLKSLREYVPGMILCDYKMPSLDAPEVLKMVREYFPEIPFIVVSGTIGEEIAVEMIKCGAVDYVMKGKLFRLVPAVRRAVKEAEERVERRKEVQVKEETTQLKITDQKQRMANEEAKRANKAKSEFLANMSHELRTPLSTIIGFSELLFDEKFGPLNEHQKKYAEIVLSSGRRLLVLIDDILDLSCVESGKMTLKLSSFSLKKFLEEVLRLIKGLAASKKVKLNFEIPEDLGEIQADPRKVKQVLYNLLSNAIKFTPARGEAGLRTQRDGGGIEITVWDTGIGVPPEDLENVFEAFRRLGNVYTQETEGAGLGLTIAKQIVELHGGRIWIESGGTGKGTTVKFTLPVKGV